MIDVLALDKTDGWVFARENGQVLLCRPPYRVHEARPASEAMVARAVAHHGYSACDKSVASWGEVAAFARREVAAQHAAEGRPLPAEGVGRALLKNASPTIIERLLDRITLELVPRGELAKAEEMLIAIQAESLRILDSPELLRKTSALLLAVRKQQEERLQRLVASNRPVSTTSSKPSGSWDKTPFDATASNHQTNPLASGAYYSPLVLYLQIHAPDEVVIGEPFEITVIARPHGDPQDRFEIRRTTDGPIDVEVEVRIPENSSVEPLGILVQPLRVVDGVVSARLGFSFIARAAGPLLFSIHADAKQAFSPAKARFRATEYSTHTTEDVLILAQLA